VFVVPVKDVHELDLAFQLPGVAKLFMKKPDHYFSHLLGHEGPGSVLSLLKSLGYASSLSAGTGVSADDYAFFGINIDMTEKGLDKVDDIIAIVFQYIAMLKREGVKEWIFLEVWMGYLPHKLRRQQESHVFFFVFSVKSLPRLASGSRRRRGPPDTPPRLWATCTPSRASTSSLPTASTLTTTPASL